MRGFVASAAAMVRVLVLPFSPKTPWMKHWPVATSTLMLGAVCWATAKLLSVLLITPSAA